MCFWPHRLPPPTHLPSTGCPPPPPCTPARFYHGCGFTTSPCLLLAHPSPPTRTHTPAPISLPPTVLFISFHRMHIHHNGDSAHIYIHTPPPRGTQVDQPPFNNTHTHVWDPTWVPTLTCKKKTTTKTHRFHSSTRLCMYPYPCTRWLMGVSDNVAVAGEEMLLFCGSE